MSKGLSVNRVVNASVTLSPTAAGTRNFGVLLVLGASDVIDTAERLRPYDGIDDIAVDFGTAAPEYAAAKLYYSANPKPLTCYVGRWAKSATAGRLRGAILGTAGQAISNFTSITSGAFSVTIDGSAVAVSGVNLSAVSNLNGVSSAVTAKLGAAGVCVWDGSRFVIKSASTGKTSVVTGVTATPLSTAMGLASGTTQVDGIAAETLETAVADMLDLSSDWYGLLVADPSTTDDELLAAAALIEAAEAPRVLGIHTSNTAVLDPSVATDIASRAKAAGYTRTFVQYSSTTPYAIASAFGRAFTVNFLGENTTITLMFKQETGVTTEYLRSGEATALKNKSCNVFVNYDNGTAILQYGTMASGMYFDERHGADWMANYVQTAAWNALYTSTTKIAQTDAGVARLTTKVEHALEQAVRNGLVAPGVWNGDDLGAIKSGDTLTAGYYVYAQPIADQEQADRAARKAPPIQCAVKFAGAIHSVDIALTVNR